MILVTCLITMLKNCNSCTAWEWWTFVTFTISGAWYWTHDLKVKMPPCRPLCRHRRGPVPLFDCFVKKNSALYPDSFVRGIKTHFMWPTAPSNCLHFFSFWQNFKILMNFSPLLWTLRSSVCQHICMPPTSAKTQWMTKYWTAPSLKFRSSYFLVEPLSAFIGGILNY